MELRTASAAALAAVALAGPAEELVFAPPTGADVTKRFETRLAFVVDENRMVVDGEEQDLPLEPFAADFGLELRTLERVLAVAAGRPTDLRRRYDAARAWVESGEGERAELEADALVRRTARFLWNAEEAAYERSFAEDGGGDARSEADPRLLGVLVEDLDLRALLPAAEVEEGATWDVPPGVLVELLVPGLDLTALLAAEGAGLFEVEGDVPALDVAALLSDAEATCTLAGFEEAADGGGRRAILALHWSFDGSLDLAPEAIGMRAGENTEIEAFDFALELDVEGRVAWDTAAGRFREVSLAGEGTIVIATEMVYALEPIEMTIENTIEASFTVSARASVEGSAEPR